MYSWEILNKVGMVIISYVVVNVLLSFYASVGFPGFRGKALSFTRVIFFYIVMSEDTFGEYLESRLEERPFFGPFLESRNLRD